MAKLLSSTGKTELEVSPDGNSIIMRSGGHQVYWPLKDWPDARKFIDAKYDEFHGDKK